MSLIPQFSLLFLAIFLGSTSIFGGPAPQPLQQGELHRPVDPDTILIVDSSAGVGAAAGVDICWTVSQMLDAVPEGTRTGMVLLSELMVDGKKSHVNIVRSLAALPWEDKIVLRRWAVQSEAKGELNLGGGLAAALHLLGDGKGKATVVLMTAGKGADYNRALEEAAKLKNVDLHVLAYTDHPDTLKALETLARKGNGWGASGKFHHVRNRHDIEVALRDVTAVYMQTRAACADQFAVLCAFQGEVQVLLNEIAKRDREIKTLCLLLENCKEEQKKSRDELKKWEADFKRCQHELAECHKTLEGLKSQLADKDKKIHDFNLTIVVKDRTIINLAADLKKSQYELAESYKSLESLKGQLADKDKKIQALSFSVEKKEHALDLLLMDIKKFQHELLERHKTLEDLKSQLADKDKKLQESSLALGTKEQTLALLQVDLKKYQYELAESYKSLESLKSQLADKDKKLQESSLALTDKEHALARLQAEVKKGQYELTDCLKALEGLKSQLADKDKKLQEFSLTLADKERTLSHLQQESSLALADKDRTLAHAQEDVRTWHWYAAILLVAAVMMAVLAAFLAVGAARAPGKVALLDRAVEVERTRLTDALREKSHLEHELTRTRAELEGEAKAAQRLGAELARVAAECEHVRADNSQLKQQNLHLEIDTAGRQKEVADLRAEVARLQNDNQQGQKEVARTALALELVHKDFSSLSADRDRLGQELQQVKKDMGHAQSHADVNRIHTLEVDNAQLCSRTEHLERLLHDCKQESREFQMELDRCREQLPRDQEKYTAMLASEAGAIQKADQLQRQVEELKSQLLHAQAHLNEIKTARAVAEATALAATREMAANKHYPAAPIIAPTVTAPNSPTTATPVGGANAGPPGSAVSGAPGAAVGGQGSAPASSSPAAGGGAGGGGSADSGGSAAYNTDRCEDSPGQVSF